jgi:hypothetical protein
MTDTLCAVCGRPVADQAYLCDRDTRMLAVDISEVPGLEPELEVTLTRQDRVGESGGGGVTKRAEEPLPFSAVASEAGYVLTNTLTTWGRHVAEERGVPGPQGSPAATEAARWFLGHLEWLRHRPEAAQAYDEITSAVGMVRLVIDRHGSRWYAGPCYAPTAAGPCEADLYGRPGATVLRCTECGTDFDAHVRQQWLLEAARDSLAHAELIGRAAPTLGVAITPAMIRGYAFRGRLTHHGHDGAGRPLYRVGDVLDLAQQAMTARSHGRRPA